MRLLLAIICGALSLNTKAQSGSYIINPGLSSVSFSIRHMAFLEVDGEFVSFNGYLKVSDQWQTIHMSAQIQVASLDTKNEERDRTILSEAYLDADNYPKIIFHSDKSHLRNDTLIVEGKLRIKKVAQPVTIPLLLTQEASTIWLNGETILKRSNFDLDFGLMNDLIDEKIQVKLKAVFVPE